MILHQAISVTIVSFLHSVLRLMLTGDCSKVDVAFLQLFSGELRILLSSNQLQSHSFAECFKSLRHL